MNKKLNTLFIVAFSLLIVVIIKIFISLPLLHPVEETALGSTSTNSTQKILILSSRGGGGHTSVAEALSQYLKQLYPITVVSVFEDTLAPIDLLKRITGKKISGERLYNSSLKNSWRWVTSFIINFGPWYFNIHRHAIQDLLYCLLLEKKPNLIISVVPVINSMLVKAAEKANIPLLLVPTDLDIRTFIKGINSPTHKNFHVALSFNDDMIMNQLKYLNMDNDKIHITGFPVRKQFLLNKNERIVQRNTMRQKLNIPDHIPTIFLMTGSMGSKNMLQYATLIAKVMAPLHLIVAMGRSEELEEKLKKINFPPHIQTTFLGFTSEIANYMAAADLLITKPGSVSVCEAIYMDLPMLLDDTCKVLIWERLNHAIIHNNGFGSIIKQAHNIPCLIAKALSANRSQLNIWKQNLINYDKNNPAEAFPALIKQIFELESKA